MNVKDDIINNIIEIEGEYVDNPDDSGGPTRWGITRSVAMGYGYQGRMQELPRDLAFEIYVKKYWQPLSLDDIERLSPALANEIADSGINVGTRRAGRWLQRSLNVLNQKANLWRDLIVDGRPGQLTIDALKSLLRYRGQDGAIVLLRMLNALQGQHYISLAERREKDETFVFGWFKHRVK